MRPINTTLKVVHSAENYHAVPRFAVTPCIGSLEEACEFIDEMTSDLFETCRGIDDPHEVKERGFVHYANSYIVGIEDFVTQVNNLDFEPTNWQKVTSFVTRKAVPRKLDEMLDVLGFIEPIRYFMEEFCLPLKEGMKVSDEEGEEMNLQIEDEFMRLYLSNYLVDSVIKAMEEKKVMTSSDYPGLAKEFVEEPLKRVKTRYIWASAVALALGAIGTSVPMYFAHVEAKTAAWNAELEEFSKGLDQDELVLLNDQYIKKFNEVLEQVEDFKGKYWLDQNQTANFYLCYKKLFKDEKGVPKVEHISELAPCIDELTRKIDKNSNAFRSADVAEYLDNYKGFSKIVQEKVEELRGIEAKIDQAYVSRLEKIKEFEKEKGKSLADLRSTITSTKNPFEKRRDRFHLEFAVAFSPVEYYSLILSEGHYVAKYTGRGAKKPTGKILVTRNDIDEFGAVLLKEYLVQEKPENVKPSPFWDKSGHFDKGVTLAHNYHRRAVQ